MSTMAKVRAQIGASTSPSTLVLGPSSSTPSPPVRSVQPSVRRSASLPPIASLREPTPTPSCPPTVPEKPLRKRVQRVMCGDGESHMLRRSKRKGVTGKCEFCCSTVTIVEYNIIAHQRHTPRVPNIKLPLS